MPPMIYSPPQKGKRRPWNWMAGKQTLQRSWDIDSWYGQSLQNKPYLALDRANRIYVTDPEGYRILVFDETGEFVTSLGQYGSDAASFQLPTGIAIDPQGNIYVADPGTHRVLKFPPLD